MVVVFSMTLEFIMDETPVFNSIDSKLLVIWEESTPLTQDEIKVFNTSSFENIMICTDVSNSSVFLNAGLVDEMIRGDNLENTLSNTTTGLISGAVSYGINLKFDQLLPNGLIGGNNYLNSVLTGATREVISNFGGSFAGEFSRTWDFENSVRSAANPFNIGLSAVSGGLSGGLDFENSPKPKTQSPIIESLNLIPYYPMPIILPPVRTVIPPVYKPNNNFRYNFNN